MSTSNQWQALLSSRIPATPYTLPYQLLLYTPCVYLAYLARRDGTYTLRLLIAPVVVSCILFSGWGFVWIVEDALFHNWGQSCLSGFALSKSLEYAFTKDGMLKINEIRPGILAPDPKKKPPKTHPNGIGNHPPPPPPRRSTQWQGLIDAFELLHTCRGLNFRFGTGTHIPTHRRPLHPPRAFLTKTLQSALLSFLLMDLAESTLKLFPGVNTLAGGSIYYPSLSRAPALRLLVASVIHVSTGCTLLFGFRMVYDFITLFAVGLCGSAPGNWPPVMDDPWRADSLHRFWAKDWHQALRRTFFVFGGYPARQLFRFFFGRDRGRAEKFAVVFGTFVASALWHECTMYAAGRGFSWVPVLFFVMQTVFLAGERMWRRITGKMVGGLWGRIWVYFVIFILSQPTVDSWHRRGFGGGTLISPSLSLFRAVIFPLMKKGLASLKY